MRVPDTIFTLRDADKGTFIKTGSYGYFDNKRVVVFSLPGAFTPTCSNYQLPAYDDLYQEFIDLGIDEVYCISVNDGFVMNAWGKSLGIENVKLIPDGSGDFTRAMGMQVEKHNLGFGYRSWRYAMVVNNGEIEQMFEEEGKIGNCPIDPYERSKPETVLEYLRSYGATNNE
jgi:peroxiredoxin